MLTVTSLFDIRYLITDMELYWKALPDLTGCRLPKDGTRRRVEGEIHGGEKLFSFSCILTSLIKIQLFIDRGSETWNLASQAFNYPERR